jgi:hypothetical protein
MTPGANRARVPPRALVSVFFRYLLALPGKLSDELIATPLRIQNDRDA